MNLVLHEGRATFGEMKLLDVLTTKENVKEKMNMHRALEACFKELAMSKVALDKVYEPLVTMAQKLRSDRLFARYVCQEKMQNMLPN